MNISDLKQNAYFLELASSVFLAIKLATLIWVSVGLGDQPMMLGFTLVLFVGATRWAESKLEVDDPSWRVLAWVGILYFLLGWTDMAASLNSGEMLGIIPVVALCVFYLNVTDRQHPFTRFFAKVDSIPVLRTQHCQLWLAIYGVTVLTWLVLPVGAYHGLASLFALGGVILHLYLQFVGVGPSAEPVRERQIGEFRFVRMNNTEQELAPLYRLYVAELMPSLMEGDRFHDAPQEQVVREKMKADQNDWRNMVFFAAYHNDALVGTMCCQFDAPSEPLPFENSHSRPLSLNKFRRIGGVTEFGKFCVEENYRMMPEVFSGLLLCGVEMSMSRHAVFVVLQSVMKTARIYPKLGFVAMTKEPVVNIDHGVKVQLFVKNMTNRNDVNNPILSNTDNSLSYYVFYRYVWMQILRGVMARKDINKEVATLDLPALAEFQ